MMWGGLQGRGVKGVSTNRGKMLLNLGKRDWQKGKA